MYQHSLHIKFRSRETCMLLYSWIVHIPYAAIQRKVLHTPIAYIFVNTKCSWASVLCAQDTRWTCALRFCDNFLEKRPPPPTPKPLDKTPADKQTPDTKSAAENRKTPFVMSSLFFVLLYAKVECKSLLKYCWRLNAVTPYFVYTNAIRWLGAQTIQLESVGVETPLHYSLYIKFRLRKTCMQ